MDQDLSALSEAQFAAEVSQAFRHYHSLLNLSRSPLAHSALVEPALVLDAVSPTADERGRALRVALRWAVNRLAPAPVAHPSHPPDFADPFWRDPHWQSYIVLHYRYIQPLSPDDIEDLGCNTLTEALLNLTGIASEHNLFDERNRAISQAAGFLREQIVHRKSDDELRRMAVEEICQSLQASPQAFAMLELAATFRGAFPRLWLLEMAKKERLTRAAAALDHLVRERLLVEGDAGANLLMPPALQVYLHARQSKSDLLRRHQSAAEFYAAECDPLETAWHLHQSGQYTQAAAVLLQAAGELVGDLQLEELRDALLQFSASQLSTELWRAVQTLLSDLLWKTGDRDGALAACRRALEATSEPGRQAHLYRVLGKLHEDHNPLIALGHYAKADQLFAPDDAERPALLKDRAWLHIHRCEWAKAQADLTLALALAAAWPDSLQTRRQRADIHNAFSGLYRRQERYEPAIVHMQEALALRETLGDAALIADSHNSLGLIYAEMREPESALRAYTEALTIYRKMGYQERIASTYLNLGGAHYYAGRYDQAIALYQSGLDIFTRLQLPRGQAEAHYNLAEAYSARGETDQARQHWQTGVEQSRREGLKDVLERFEELRKKLGAEAVRSDTHVTPAQLLPKEQLTLDIARREGQVTTKRLVEQGLSRADAKRILKRLAERGLLLKVGQGRPWYVLPR
jgi:tetratricopeptide (TPR) repeat protein